uniref:ING domain-containing protein n=1 Tax=Heterorhabditis bacteriophora TaxID=37862 RepID=A0A1I7WJH8_HETBA
MIVEQIELKEDYNELKTFLAEVHKYVHTEIEDPPEGSKALDHFKQKRVEYKKYLLTMNNFAETLKSSSESLKKIPIALSNNNSKWAVPDRGARVPSTRVQLKNVHKYRPYTIIVGSRRVKGIDWNMN